MEKLTTNDHYQVVKVEFAAGTMMRRHIATSDAFLIVESGSALLVYANEIYELNGGDNISIPANEQHLLRPIEDFKGYIVLSGEGRIEYAQKS